MAPSTSSFSAFLRDRGPLVALGVTLAFAWANLLTTTRWAYMEGSLNGWKQPWYFAALAFTTVLAVIYRRRIGRPADVRWLPAVVFVAGAATIVTCLFLRLPVSTWHQIPFDDDWIPLLEAAIKGVHRLERAAVMGWDWYFLGGYPTSTDIGQSFAVHVFLPMQIFGERIGFHLVHAVWFLSVPVYVWWDLRHEDRKLAWLAAGFACFTTAGISMSLGQSGDVNSLAGLFSAGMALVGSRAARLGRRWGGPVIALGLTLALYSHVGFFAYAGLFLTVEAIYYRDLKAFFRLAGAAAVAVVAALPVHWESLRHPDYVSTNNVVFNPDAPLNWPALVRGFYYNVEILLLPHRWFNDYRSLVNVWMPAVIVVALVSGRSRVGFYAWATIAAQAVLRLNAGEFGAGFDRIMHMLPMVSAPALAGFVLRFTGAGSVAWAASAAIAIYTAISFTPVPRVDDVREFHPALIDRLATLDGNMVLFEVSPHRDMDSDPQTRTPKAPWDVHIEALLPAVAGQRLYSQMWDGWVWSVFRGQVVGGGTYAGKAIAKTPVEDFLAEMRRWGVRHLLVWTDATRTYLADSGRFAERWRDGVWSHFELIDADVRSVATVSGSGELRDLDDLGAVVELREVTAGERVVVRTNYYPAWRAHADGRPVQLYSHEGQLAFDAPASGSYRVDLVYPARRGLLLFSAVMFVIGITVLGRKLH